LMKAGFTVTIHSRTKSKADELLQEGAIWADSVAQCAKGKDAVITIVGYPEDVEQVYFGEGGLLENACPDTIVIDMTTSRPALAAEIYDKAKAKSLHALDAPVTGGEPKAISGEMTIMIGGDETTFHKAMPLFSAMGANIRYQGTAGMGQHCKLANQIGIAGALSGACEALAYAKAVGLDPQIVFDTIKTGSAQSTQLDLMGPKILTKEDTPSFYLKHILKDLRLSIEEVEKTKQTLPMATFVRDAYSKLEQDGCGNFGSQSLYRYYEGE